jgi:23S rRNA pseudouridine2604 synthase
MLSNSTSDELISKGWIEIDGVTIYKNCFLPKNAEVKVNGKIERERREWIYLKFNKPAGYVSTLNSEVENNLKPFFEGLEGLSIAGRLDKQSEGLLILSDNGKWVETICNPRSFKEKEYVVTLDEAPDEQFVSSFKKGVLINSHQTLPCYCQHIGGAQIRVVLTEGKNRQIRRMCMVLGRKVLRLKRVRIAEFELGDLEEGKIELITMPSG